MLFCQNVIVIHCLCLIMGQRVCDFPKGSAEILYDSVQQLYKLPEQTRVFLCHDYKPDGRTEFCMKPVFKHKSDRAIFI